MSLGIVWRIYVGFVVDIDIKILGVPPPGVGHAFPRQQHMRKGGEGGVLFISTRVFFPVRYHPWMDDGTNEWMDGWTSHVKKLHEKPHAQCTSVCVFDDTYYKITIY
jgi:hypothetical protein